MPSRNQFLLYRNLTRFKVLDQIYKNENQGTILKKRNMIKLRNGQRCA